MKNNNAQNRPIGNWIYNDIEETRTCFEKIKKISECVEYELNFRIENYEAYHFKSGSTIYFAFDEKSLRISDWQYNIGGNRLIYKIVATEGYTESEINIEFAKFCQDLNIK